MEGAVKSKHDTVLDAILMNFRMLDDKPALHWLDHHCKVVESYSYRQLDVRTSEIAKGLLSAARDKDCSSPPVVVLCYTPGLDFILTFLGCLRAGFIPVPVKSPDDCKILYKKTLFKIIQDCDAMFVLSHQEFLEELLGSQEEPTSNYLVALLKSTSAEWLYEGHQQVYQQVYTAGKGDAETEKQDNSKEVSRLETVEEIQELEEEAAKPEDMDKAQPQDVAFLQYTNSGKPKGVMVTFDSILHNFQIMKHIYCTNSSTKEICLLPHFNGFALVGSFLHTLYEGAAAYFVAPKTFFNQPAIWMEAMSKYKLTHSKVPCSAFINSLIPQPGYSKEINLKLVDCIACIEPVSYEGVDKFEKYMSQFGLRRSVISVGYGLAEHVCVVCSPCISREENRVVDLNRMDCGQPSLGVTVKIVDQLGCIEVPEAVIGEIWVSSKSKASGYFKNEQTTLDVFNARIGDESDDVYLRTGDLGFMKDGRLFVCEKLADVLTIRDDNCIYPLDLEMAAESAVSEICPGKSIAFHFRPFSHSDEISILAELKSADYTDEDCLKFQSEITAEIIKTFDQLSVHAVILFKPCAMPHTPFGRRERALSHRLAYATELQVYNKSIKPKPEKWMSDKDKMKLPPKVTPKPPRKHQETKKKLILTPPSKAYPSISERVVLSPVPFQRLESKQSSPKPSMHLESSPTKSKSTVQFRVSPPPVSMSSPVELSVNLPVKSASVSPPTERTSEVSSPVRSSLHKQNLSKVKSSLQSAQLKSPMSDSRLSSFSDFSESLSPYFEGPLLEGRHSPLRSRRLSAPVQPLFSRPPPTSGKRRKKRAKSIADEFMAKSSLDGLLHALGRRMKCTVRPGEKIWEDESAQVDAIATMLQEDYGFHMSKETLLLAQSPEDLLKAMKMSLLSTEIVVQEPFRLSFTNLPPPIFDPFLIRVYWSECRLYLKNVEQYKHQTQDIAIVGMGGLFTGSSCNSVNDLWDLITDCKTASSQQCFKKPQDAPKFNHEDYLIDDCDISSFTPSEKMLLQAVRKCLFNAGFTHNPDGSASNWGVFAALPQGTSATASCIAGIYNFTGPTMETKTTHGSLSPLSMAFLHLQSNNCDAAIVCGAEETVMSAKGDHPYAYCAALLLMSVGMARKFDRRILAIVKATACSNQGGGYSAVYTPNQASQSQLLRQTISKANILPSEVAYIEADGKGGTQKRVLEMDCIQRVLGSKSGNTGNVVVSSLKANIGDLGAVSSIVSIIKTVMVLQHAQVPGTLPSTAVTKPTDQDKSDNLVCFPVEMAHLSSVKHGKLLTAAVNCFEDTGRNEVAVIQQYGILPHLAGVSTWLMLAADHIVTDKCWPEEVEKKASFYKKTIESLKSQIPVFANAFTCFSRVFDATVKQYNFDSVEVLAARNKVMVLKLYYGFMAQFFSSGLEIPMIGSTNAMNEVAALLFAGSIDLSTAILFLCCKHVSNKDPEKPTKYRIGPQKLAKLIRTPKIYIFSCIEHERLSEDIFADKALLSQYVSKLCDSIGETHVYCHMYKILMSKGPAKPFVYIDSSDKARGDLQRKSLVVIAFKSLQDKHSTRYLRDKYLGLRSYYDSAVAKAEMIVKEKRREISKAEVKVEREKNLRVDRTERSP